MIIEDLFLNEPLNLEEDRDKSIESRTQVEDDLFDDRDFDINDETNNNSLIECVYGPPVDSDLFNDDDPRMSPEVYQVSTKNLDGYIKFNN